MIRKPAAKRNTLALLAGIVWSLTGLFLSTIAATWLAGSSTQYVATAVIAGVGAGWLIYYFKFGKLATENIHRIYAQSPGQDKVCVFAFQNMRSYFLVLVMMSMGYIVRHSGVPKPYLSPFYLAIGVAMILSSLSYYRHLNRAA